MTCPTPRKQTAVKRSSVADHATVCYGQQEVNWASRRLVGSGLFCSGLVSGPVGDGLG